MTYPVKPLRLPWAALLTAAVLLAPGEATARPVTAADMQITYRFTDEDGDPTTTELNPDDLSYYMNRARCQCGEQIAARVNLLPSSDGTYDTQPVRTYVGSRCDQGQDNLAGQAYPCVKYLDGQPNEYDNGGTDIVFESVWLSSGAPSLTDQSPSAQPVNPCLDNQSGEGGIWVCAEDGTAPDCQGSEFIITGSQNQNSGGAGTTPTDPTQGGTTGSSGGIVFDYQAPMGTVTDFSASPGDGRVVLRWTRTESADFNGFRVLCADMSGEPPPDKGTSLPPLSQRTDGRLYYTAENLCPGEVVYSGESTGVDLPLPGGGDAGDESGTTSAGLDDVFGDGWLGGGVGTSGTTGATGTSGTTGDTGAGTTSNTGGVVTSTSGLGSSDGTTGDGGGATTGGSGMSVADSPLASLDWAFVCSDHITSTGTEAEINGLQNGVPYQFIVVAYDRAGNPLVVSGDEVLVQTPERTTDFWERCEEQGDLCGDGGFCHCRAGADEGAGWLGSGLLALVLLGLRRRSPA